MAEVLGTIPLHDNRRIRCNEAGIAHWMNETLDDDRYLPQEYLYLEVEEDWKKTVGIFVGNGKLRHTSSNSLRVEHLFQELKPQKRPLCVYQQRLGDLPGLVDIGNVVQNRERIILEP